MCGGASLVDVLLVAATDEVLNDWTSARKTLEGGVHVACVAKVTQTRQYMSLCKQYINEITRVEITRYY